MRKRNRRPPCRKIVLKPPGLDHAKSAGLNSLSSPYSRRNYKFAMEQFITWYCSEPRLWIWSFRSCVAINASEWPMAVIAETTRPISIRNAAVLLGSERFHWI